MNRLDFMKQLESLLSDITESEREEALQYYNDYLNDAGVENEQEVLESLGTPEALAKVIKDGLAGNDDGGEFTETGYKSSYYEEEKKQELMKKDDNKLSSGMIVLIVILCILGAPMLFGAASGIFGAGMGLLGALLGITLGVGATTIALFIAAVCLIGIGIGELFTLPLAGACLIGAGLLLAGLGLLCLCLSVWVYGTAIPWMVRKIVELCGRLFHKKGEEA